MIIDAITYNGEEELFEIRYNVLKDVVDEFRVIEFDQTFSGKPKKQLFNQGIPKVKSYFVSQETWGKYRDQAIESPNTLYGAGASHWITEFCQKESIKDCLTDLKDEDIVFIGDVDEIYSERAIGLAPDWVKEHKALKLKLRVYSYWLNNRSSEEFWGTTVASYGNIKDNCLNHLRNKDQLTQEIMGWHFTSMGGYEKVKQKLMDSYTEDSYANPIVIYYLYDNMFENRDFLGRPFTYTTDESDWPEYLKQNKDKYSHLIK